jgi:hypothetical protein
MWNRSAYTKGIKERICKSKNNFKKINALFAFKKNICNFAGSTIFSNKTLNESWVY